MLQLSVKFDRPLVNAVIVDPSNADEVPSETPKPAQAAVTVPPADSDAAAADEPADAPEPPPAGPSIAESNQQRDQLLEKIAQSVGDMRQLGDEAIAQWQSLAVRFASIMVKQIAGNSDAIQADRLTQLVGDLINRPEIPLRIAVHPDDFPLIESCLESHGELAESIELVPETNVPSGECRAIYEGHELVSKLEEQLPDIEYRLVEALRSD